MTERTFAFDGIADMLAALQAGASAGAWSLTSLSALRCR